MQEMLRGVYLTGFGGKWDIKNIEKKVLMNEYRGILFLSWLDIVS